MASRKSGSGRKTGMKSSKAGGGSGATGKGVTPGGTGTHTKKSKGTNHGGYGV
jgi:hypothetical protein